MKCNRHPPLTYNPDKGKPNMDCFLPAAIAASYARRNYKPQYNEAMPDPTDVPTDDLIMTDDQIMNLLNDNIDDINRLKDKSKELHAVKDRNFAETIRLGECVSRIIQLYDKRDAIVNMILGTLDSSDREWRPTLLEELELNKKDRALYEKLHTIVMTIG